MNEPLANSTLAATENQTMLAAQAITRIKECRTEGKPTVLLFECEATALLATYEQLDAEVSRWREKRIKELLRIGELKELCTKYKELAEARGEALDLVRQTKEGNQA